MILLQRPQVSICPILFTSFFKLIKGFDDDLKAAASERYKKIEAATNGVKKMAASMQAETTDFIDILKKVKSAKT
jgi:hypothetical protein